MLKKPGQIKQDADYIFYELTRSICPKCLVTVDAQILLKAGRVIMRKRCPEHGWFESLLSSDADMYINSLRYNKPGTIPLGFSTEVVDGCPSDCGLCPEHKQHTCLGLIEVNSHCNLDCPICFADAKPGFSLSLAQVERMLDRFIELEGNPEVVQFSGGEPTIHPDILPMLRMAVDKGIEVVMINTNGIRIANDDKFLAALADIRPTIYLQFDGFSTQTHEQIRGRDLLDMKLKALDRLAQAKLDVVLVPAIEKGINHDEIGRIVKFGIEHPAVHGIAFQPVTHSGRYMAFDPMDRETVADVIHGISEQTDGMFVESDFIPVPCCHPTCRSATYAYVENGKVTPLPRVVDVDKYLDYIANRTLPDIRPEILEALEGLWSASSVPGSSAATSRFECAACNMVFPSANTYLKNHIFMIVVQGFADAYTVDLKALMKCCVGELIPDGRIIPFCAYNSAGYREKVRAELLAGRMQ
ncbi:MAG: radical SAM protein [Dehalococcoidia bacterium]